MTHGSLWDARYRPALSRYSGCGGMEDSILCVRVRVAVGEQHRPCCESFNKTLSLLAFAKFPDTTFLCTVAFAHRSKHTFVLKFLPRDALMRSAVLRLHFACRPSVCLSVRGDVGGSGSHKLEILESNCTDN